MIKWIMLKNYGRKRDEKKKKNWNINLCLLVYMYAFSIYLLSVWQLLEDKLLYRSNSIVIC